MYTCSTVQLWPTEHTCILACYFYVELEVKCVTGMEHSFQVFECTANNQLRFVLCSFDEKTPRYCSFPLEVNIYNFGTEKHTLDVLFVDTSWQRKTVSFEFQLAGRRCITRNLALKTHTVYIIVAISTAVATCALCLVLRTVPYVYLLRLNGTG